MNIAGVLASKGGTVVTIRPEQTVREALALLADHNIGAVIVVDSGGRPTGVVSERDIVRAMARSEGVGSKAVGTIMTSPVIVGSPQDDLFAVGHTMTEKRIRHIPVVDKGALVGIVSIGDVLKAQRDKYQGEVDTLQFQILQRQ